MPDLTWKHHALIQSLLSRGPLKEEEFYKVFEGVTGRNPGAHPVALNSYLLKINEELSYIQFELRVSRNQYDGKVYYGVVNNVADEQSKLGTKYTVPQITFFKAIIEAIVQDGAGQGSISTITALNLRLTNQASVGSQSQVPSQSQGSGIPTALKNFSLSLKEKTLEELVRDGWLCFISVGNVGLGIRSFLDLRGWFRLNDVPPCEACNEAGVTVEFCPNEGCSVRLHKYCLIKKFSQRKGNRVCPGCGNTWLFRLSQDDILEHAWDLNEPVAEAQPLNEGSQRKKRKVPKSEFVQERRAPKSEFVQERWAPKSEYVQEVEDEPSHAQVASRRTRGSRQRSCVTDDSDVAGSRKASNDVECSQASMVSTRRSTRTMHMPAKYR